MTETTLLWGPPQIIDPEDRGQMERFARLHDEAWRRVVDRNPNRVGTPTWEIVAEQFRLFKDPAYRAKPDEPLGLGAVVEDAEGALWFRLTLENQTWPGEVWAERYGDADRWSKWESVSAVRVLSPGVTE